MESHEDQHSKVSNFWHYYVSTYILDKVSLFQSKCNLIRGCDLHSYKTSRMNNITSDQEDTEW